MEAVTAIFMLIAVSGNQDGRVVLSELARFPTEDACLTAARATTLAVSLGGKLSADGLACIPAANLKALGITLIGR